MTALRGVFVAFLVGVSAPAMAQVVSSDFGVESFGLAPDIPEEPVTAELATAIRVAFTGALAPIGSVSRTTWSPAQQQALDVVAAAGDPRLAWLISDLMQFTVGEDVHARLAEAGAQILGITLVSDQPRHEITDYLIAWDVPAFPGYLDVKRSIYTSFLFGWERLFREGDIDWRLVGWGGVPIDARPYDRTHILCNCIPAADNPETSTARAATWLDDDDIVFGLSVGGEHRAYPLQIMEVREMVNDTLGGRDLAMPYCSLCGAAQAYFTDTLPDGVERPILRTTGLLLRSNKVMYDIVTHSIFDTFRGVAVTGPLADEGVELERTTVITTDWGTWRATYPDTSVLVEDLALGRNFDFRNGRDAEGPIFPIGDVDPRLPVHADVIGVVTERGPPIAFERGAAFLALNAGQDVVVDEVRLVLEAGGMRAEDLDGGDLGSHQAYWFAWSQFHPETRLWTGNR